MTIFLCLLFFHLCQNARFLRWMFLFFFCFFLAFYAKIQDARQKWLKNNFWEKLPVVSADTLGVKNDRNSSISHYFRDKSSFFSFYAENQDGRHKWRENYFGKSRQLTLQLPWGWVSGPTLSPLSLSGGMLNHKYTHVY